MRSLFPAEADQSENAELYLSAVRVAFVAMTWVSQARLLSFHAAQTPLQLVVGLAFLAIALLAMIGLGGPVTTILLAAALLVNRQFLGFADFRPDLVHHHVTLLATVLLIVSLAPSFSFLTPFPRAKRALWSAADAMALLRLSVVTVFGFAAFHQLRALIEGRQVVLNLFITTYTGSLGALGPRHEALFTAISVANAIVLIFIALGLCLGKTRRIAVWTGWIYLAAVYPLLPVQVLSAALAVLLAAFLPRESFDRFFTRAFGRATR